MKPHTVEERIEAKKKVPKPTSDYLDSNVIAETYLGIMRKHSLNLRQGAAMSEVVNVTLEGLEPESALESNLHQALPEITNATMRELMLDINDRVLKEAARRLRENVVAPDTWDVEVLGPKPTEEERRREALKRGEEEKNDDDPELAVQDEAELEKTVIVLDLERKRISEEIARSDAEYEKSQEDSELRELASDPELLKTLREEEPELAKRIDTLGPAPTSTVSPKPASVPAGIERTEIKSVQSIVEKKMAEPRTEKPENVVVAATKLPEVPKPLTGTTQTTPTPAPTTPTEKKIDPYREAVE